MKVCPDKLQHSCLETAFFAHRAALRRFLIARGAADAAEDLLQELWMKVSSAPEVAIHNPLSYLYKVAGNLMLDRHRAEMRAARRDRDWGEVNDLSACAKSGEDILLMRERVRQIERGLDALGMRVATVFRLYRIEGMNQRQIALNLDLSLSSVEKDLQKAYRMLLALQQGD